MKAPDYGKTHYVVDGDAEEIAQHLPRSTFTSSGEAYVLAGFEAGAGAPSILFSPGSGGYLRDWFDATV